MKHSKYQQHIGATEACNKRMMESKPAIRQRNKNEVTKDCFTFDAWISSKKSSEASMEVCADLICMVKTNTKLLFFDITENLTKYWTVVSYLLLSIKPMIPRARLLIAVHSKDNARKVLSFIVTDNIGITQEGLTYSYKDPDQFYNVSILPVAHPLVMHTFIGSINPHNKSMQYDSELENVLVTQCCWI